MIRTASISRVPATFLQGRQTEPWLHEAWQGTRSHSRFFSPPSGSIPGAASAQVRAGQPTAVFPEDFGAIQTVRELPDGRVLVADPLSKALYAVDMAAGTRTVIGREGEGPEEYRQPDAVWPLPGDSTLLVDLGNGRLVALGPDLKFGPTMPITVGEFQPGRPLVLAIPQGVDGAGKIYARMMGGGMGGVPCPTPPTFCGSIGAAEPPSGRPGSRPRI